MADFDGSLYTLERWMSDATPISTALFFFTRDADSTPTPAAATAGEDAAAEGDEPPKPKPKPPPPGGKSLHVVLDRIPDGA